MGFCFFNHCQTATEHTTFYSPAANYHFATDVAFWFIKIRTNLRIQTGHIWCVYGLVLHYFYPVKLSVQFCIMKVWNCNVWFHLNVSRIRQVSGNLSCACFSLCVCVWLWFTLRRVYPGLSVNYSRLIHSLLIGSIVEYYCMSFFGVEFFCMTVKCAFTFGSASLKLIHEFQSLQSMLRFF